jgi:HEAT repeat protein/ATP/ADP translocase
MVSRQRFKQWLARIFPVRGQEVSRVLPCFLIYFLVVAGIIFGRNARDSLFLKEIGLKYLPLMYVANGVFVVLCSLVYSAFVDRMPRALFVSITSGLFIGALAVSRLLLTLHLHWFYAGLYLIVQVIWLMSLMQFWTFAGDVFDTRESKRLFPVINLGGLLGMVAAGFGGKPLVTSFGTENLIALWALLLVGATALVLFVGRRASKDDAATAPRRKAPAKSESQLENLKEGWHNLKDSPLMRTVALITLAQWIVFTLVDYVFNAQTREHFHNNKDQMTAFFGTFRGMAGGAALVLQVFATSQLISRFGLGRTILVHPSFLILSTGWLAAKFGFLSSCAAKFGDHVLLYTVQESSYQLLYNPIPLDQRGRMRAFVEGYIKPISMAIGGAILMLAALFLSGSQLGQLSLVLSIAWFVLALRIGKAYFGALMGNLTQSQSVASVAAHQLSGMRDDETAAVLLRELRNPDEDVVLLALDVLGRVHPKHVRQAVEKMVQQPNCRIRAQALRTLGRLGSAKSVGCILPCLSDRDSAVRAAAARALGEIGEEVGAETWEALLTDADSEVVVESAVAMTKTGGLDGILKVAEVLREMLSSGAAEARAAAARVLGRLRTRHFAPSLLPLVNDPELSVRLAALTALGEIGDARGLPAALEALGNRAERRVARKAALAIVKHHKKAGVKELLGMLAEETTLSVKAERIELLGYCNGDGIVEACLAHLTVPNAEVRERALDALGRREKRQTLPEERARALQEYAAGEIRSLYESLRASAALEKAYGGEASAILTEAIEADNRNTQGRILKTVGLLTDRAAVRAITHKVRSSNARERADALEALDSLGCRELTRDLLPTLDDQEPQAMLDLCRRFLGTEEPTVEQCLGWLSDHASVWLRAALMFFIGENRLTSCDDNLLRGLQDPNGLVRETALMALADQVGAPRPRDSFLGLAEPLRQDPSPRVRALVEALTADPTERSVEMLSTMERILFLKSVSFFSQLDGESLRDLADIATEEDLPAGTSVYREGNPAEALYILVKGHCDILRKVEEEDRHLASLGPREYFGEMSLLDGAPHTTGALLTEDSTLLSVTREDFKDLIREVPDIAFGIFAELSRRLREARDLEGLAPQAEEHVHAPAM